MERRGIATAPRWGPSNRPRDSRGKGTSVDASKKAHKYANLSHTVLGYSVAWPRLRPGSNNDGKNDDNGEEDNGIRFGVCRNYTGFMFGNSWVQDKLPEEWR